MNLTGFLDLLGFPFFLVREDYLMFLTERTWQTKGKVRTSRPGVHRASPFRPQVECLESRCLLALAAAPVTFPGTEGADVFGTTIATFTDTDTTAPASNFTIAINWGDGTPLDTTTGMAVLVTPGNFNVVGHHTYLEEAGSAVPPL